MLTSKQHFSDVPQNPDLQCPVSLHRGKQLQNRKMRERGETSQSIGFSYRNAFKPLERLLRSYSGWTSWNSINELSIAPFFFRI